MKLSILQLYLESQRDARIDIVNFWNNLNIEERKEWLRRINEDPELHSHKDFYELSHIIAEKLLKVFKQELNENKKDIVEKYNILIKNEFNKILKKKFQKLSTLVESIELMKQIKNKFSNNEDLQKLNKAAELWLKDKNFASNDVKEIGHYLELFFYAVLKNSRSVKPYLNKVNLTEQKNFSIKNKHYNYSQFNQKQLDIGTKEEFEHTKDKKIARQIAADHLSENPNYYKILKKNKLEELSLTKIFESANSEYAKSKGWHHVGWGKYADETGKIVAITDKNGKLVSPKNTATITGVPQKGTVIQATGPKSTHKVLNKINTAFNPGLKTNNVKVGEYVVLKNGNKYKKEDDMIFRNVNDPSDIRFSKNLDDDSPISHAETPEGKRKQAQRFDIDTYNWNKKIQQAKEGDIITDKKGREYSIVKSPFGGNIAKPYFNVKKELEKLQKIEEPKKSDTEKYREEIRNKPIGIKKEDPDTQKYKFDLPYIFEVERQAKSNYENKKKILDIVKKIKRQGRKITKAQARELHNLGIKLNWK